MLNKLLRHSHPRSQLLPVTRAYLQRQIAALQKGRVRVRIPCLKGQMRAVPGMKFHLMPELFLQVSGLTAFSFPGESFRLLPGEICVVPRGIPHGERARPFRGPFHNFVFMFQTKFLLFHLAHNREGLPRALYGDSFEYPAQRLSEYLDDAVEAFHGAGPHRDLRVRSFLLANLSSALAILEGERALRKDESLKVVQTRHFVATHLADQLLSVQRIAEWINCSADYLSHLFHTETGKTLSVHINDMRVQQAKALLETSGWSIKEIAWASGYSDPGYFARVFRQTTGSAPKAYRTLHPNPGSHI